MSFSLLLLILYSFVFRKGVRGAFAAGLAFGFSQGTIFFAYAATFRLGAFLVENYTTTGITFEDVFL